jgi:pilus assembly protein CpaF
MTTTPVATNTQAVTVSSGVADRVRARLLSQGREASAANVVRALRSEGIVLDETSLLDVVGTVQRELLGAGPLEKLFVEPGVTDILVMGDGRVWIDRGHGLEDHGRLFRDDAHVLRIATRLAGWAGRRLDEASPFVDARLPNGIRLHCVMSPIATDGTCISLRIPRSGGLTMEQLVRIRITRCARSRRHHRTDRGETLLLDHWGNWERQDNRSWSDAVDGSSG